MHGATLSNAVDVMAAADFQKVPAKNYTLVDFFVIMHKDA